MHEARASLAAVVLLIGCDFGPLDLQGRPCPCVDGWRCEETDAGGRCVPDTDGGAPDRVPAVFVFASGLELVSLDDGTSFCPTRSDPPPTSGAAWDGERLVVTYGFPAFASVSRNGYEWSAGASVFEQWSGDIEHGNGQFLIGGGCGSIARSRDGASWEVLPSTPGDCDSIRGMAFGAGRFVVAVDSLTWWSSADGLSWALEQMDASSQVVFEDGAFRPPSPEERFRGPGGVCFSTRLDMLTRSTEPDCSFAVDVWDLGDPTKVNVVFADVPADDYRAAALPPALASCLGR